MRCPGALLLPLLCQEESGFILMSSRPKRSQEQGGKLLCVPSSLPSPLHSPPSKQPPQEELQCSSAPDTAQAMSPTRSSCTRQERRKQEGDACWHPGRGSAPPSYLSTPTPAGPREGGSGLPCTNVVMAGVFIFSLAGSILLPTLIPAGKGRTGAGGVAGLVPTAREGDGDSGLEHCGAGGGFALPLLAHLSQRSLHVTHW